MEEDIVQSVRKGGQLMALYTDFTTAVKMREKENNNVGFIHSWPFLS